MQVLFFVFWAENAGFRILRLHFADLVCSFALSCPKSCPKSAFFRFFLLYMGLKIACPESCPITSVHALHWGHILCIAYAIVKVLFQLYNTGADIVKQTFNRLYLLQLACAGRFDSAVARFQNGRMPRICATPPLRFCSFFDFSQSAVKIILCITLQPQKRRQGFVKYQCLMKFDGHCFKKKHASRRREKTIQS